MQFKKLLAVLCMGLILASGAVFAQNARVQALGTPNIGNTSLVNDLSDILTFPSDVVINADIVQGCVNGNLRSSTPASAISPGYVFGTKSILDGIAVGLVFGQPSYITGHQLAAPLGFGGWTNAGIVPFQTAFQTEYTGNVAGLGTPAAVAPNAGHLLVGMKLGGISAGLDLFREAANSNSKSETTTGTSTTTFESITNTGAMGLNAGAQLKISDFSIKAAAGLALMNHYNEVINSNPITTTKQRFETKSGLYLPIAAKTSLPMGSNTFTLGADFVLSTAGFSVHNDPGTGTVVDTNTATYSNMYWSLGVADEIEVNSSTKVTASLAVMNSGAKYTPDGTLTSTSREATANTIVFPAMSIGAEHSFGSVWKLDDLGFRIGGAKTYLWNTTSSNFDGGGSDGTTESSGTPTDNPFAWFTGLSIVKGDLTFDMVVAPGSWDGIQVINARGPVTGNLTVTYNFGGGSGGGSDYSSPAYDAPAPADDDGGDVLDF